VPLHQRELPDQSPNTHGPGCFLHKKHEASSGFEEGGGRLKTSSSGRNLLMAAMSATSISVFEKPIVQRISQIVHHSGWGRTQTFPTDLKKKGSSPRLSGVRLKSTTTMTTVFHHQEFLAADWRLNSEVALLAILIMGRFWCDFCFVVMRDTVGARSHNIRHTTVFVGNQTDKRHSEVTNVLIAVSFSQLAR
jgi:hypothetical protein